jgi:two-component system cell cycle response regulator DivK
MGRALLGGELLMSRKILIVEDSCDLRKMLGTVLAARGWNPILAESGRKALDKLERETPGIILMDMRMPDMNGFELAMILKKHRVYRSIPILAATAFPDHIARQRCLAAGCDDFISKPFSFAALQTSLTNLVSGERRKTIAATVLL